MSQVTEIDITNDSCVTSYENRESTTYKYSTSLARRLHATASARIVKVLLGCNFERRTIPVGCNNLKVLLKVHRGGNFLSLVP